MGLDMYLHKRERVSWFDPRKDMSIWTGKPKLIFEVKYKDGTKTKEVFKPKTAITAGMNIDMPFGYWRKANAIHGWFSALKDDGLENCEEIKVSGEKLLELRALCNLLLEKKDEALNEEYLPTMVGFFFGSDRYDEGYYEDLDYTAKLLKDVKPDEIYIYTANW